MPTELGSSRVEVQRCPLSSDAGSLGPLAKEIGGEIGKEKEEAEEEKEEKALEKEL